MRFWLSLLTFRDDTFNIGCLLWESRAGKLYMDSFSIIDASLFIDILVLDVIATKKNSLPPPSGVIIPYAFTSLYHLILPFSR